MKPSAFDYIRVDTLDEALTVLAESDLAAKVLAGGQSLLPMLNMRLAQPKVLVDINRLAALTTVRRLETNLAGVATQSPGTAFLEVGALVRQRQLERYALGEERARLIHTALTYVGHPQTRNQGKPRLTVRLLHTGNCGFSHGRASGAEEERRGDS